MTAEHPSTRPPGWPDLDPAAFHGPAGAFVQAADQFTEADPVAVLVTVLTQFGAACGRGPFMLAGNERHTPALFAVIAGPTATGSKGTSKGVSRALFKLVDSDFSEHGIMSGFGSGESLIDTLRGPDDDKQPERKTDRRLLISESEFARMLKTAGRDGSILSQVIRNGWDGQALEVRSRAQTSVAVDYHLAVLAQVTLEELRARLTDTETYGGFSNRFLFVLSYRSKLLPNGGNVPDTVLREHAAVLRAALEKARNRGEFHRTEAANDLWTPRYVEIAHDTPGGLLEAVIGRGAPYLLRLSLVYALLDGRAEIDVEHLEAAWAIWRYARASAEVIFGDAVGDQVADKLLSAAIRRAGPDGLDLTEQSNALGRNVRANALSAARRRLEEARLIETTADPDPTGGRPRTVSRATKNERTN